MQKFNYHSSKRKKGDKRNGYFRLLFFLFCWMAAVSIQAQQSIKISGTVTDDTGETAIGASIIVDGQTTGTMTDVNGHYTLDAPPKGKLKVSYVGYAPQTISINGRTTIDIVMKEEDEKLDEVVVIGYGTVKKRDLTGAVTSIKSGDIAIAPTTNVMEALQGKVSGMDIVKSTGQLGQDMEVLLRGSRSIYGDNSPLFIIDGIPGNYNQVNPSDIESIDVLKDASSTAIYGSAGSNGVVIITTKRGKDGKATVNFDAYFGFSGKPEILHGMRGDEWTDYQREAYKYLNGQYPADMSSILTNSEKLAAYNAGKWIDWMDEATGRTATVQKYNLSISGGTDKTRIFSSLTYNHEKGILRNEDRKRYGLRLNLDQEINQWAKAGFTSNLNYTIQDNGAANTFTKSISAFPLGDMYDEKGDLKHEYAPNEYSPLGDFIENQFVDNLRQTHVNVNGFLEITPIEGLSVRTVISAILDNSRRGQYWGDLCNARRPSYAGSPHAEINNTYNYEYTWENILSYNKIFAEKHSLGLTFVTSWNKSQMEFNIAGGSGQAIDSWSFYSLLSAASARVQSEYSQTQKMSYAARANYTFMDRYLFTFSTRWDGVSWFAEDNKWDVFPAGAIAWRITEEEFMENTLDWLNNLKLRVGYGVTGNSGGVGAYGSLTNAFLYSTSGISLDGKSVPFIQYAGTYANPDLGWEKSYNLNIGLDFSLIKRISGSIEFFNTKTKDLLFKRTIPVTNGATEWGRPLSRWENLAETSNRGVEVSIESQNIVTKDFSWNTSLSFTWSKEKIESLPSGDLIAENLFNGQPIKSFYDYKYAGIWNSDTPAETLAAYGVKPGWVKIATVPQGDDNGIHKYSENDKQILGHQNPDVVVGLSNSLTYKWFDFTVFAMARYGQTICSELLGWYNAQTGDSKNQIAGADYWTESNQNAYYPVPGSGNEQLGVITSLKYRDGSFIKIKNITLGYTFPANITKIAKIEKCRIYATAYNPFIFVKDKQLKDTDPETSGSDGFPLYKQFVFGINITF